MASAESGKSRQQRKGPAPFASFEEVSDEVRTKASSPESKQTFQLPNIEEDVSKASEPASEVKERTKLADTRALNQTLQPSTPRIDISRASSSSHHDSRDSSPEISMFSGKDKDNSKLELGFGEQGALDLRSSTEELSFMEPNTNEVEREIPKTQSCRSPLMFKTPDEKQSKHGRKDSQCSDIVLLSISGRTSRISSIGSQGSAQSNISAHSNLSHLSLHSNVTHISTQSRLSVVSGVSRSPSPHKMLLETSFCGPKPIEVEFETCANVSQERLLEMVNSPNLQEDIPVLGHEAPSQSSKIEVDTVSPDIVKSPQLEKTEKQKESDNKINEVKHDDLENMKLIEEKNTIQKISQLKPREPERTTRRKRRQSSGKQHKDVMRIKLKPDHMYDEDDDEDDSDKTISNTEGIQKPITLNLNEQNKKPAQHFTELVNRPESKKNTMVTPLDSHQNVKKKSITTLTPSVSPTPSKKHARKGEQGSRTPSPGGPNISRKSSFCSLFKSRDTIASPDSTLNLSVRKKSDVTEETRSRSKSRDRSTTPVSGGKIKGSVLALFNKPRKSTTSLSPGSRDSSPVIHSRPAKNYVQPIFPSLSKASESPKLKYYDTKDGVIHISLHTPPDEDVSTSRSPIRKSITHQSEIIAHEEITHKVVGPNKSPPNNRTVLPDGSIIIPLHSPSDELKVEDVEPEIQVEEEKSEPITVVSIETPKRRLNKIGIIKSSTSSEDNAIAIIQTVVSSIEPPPRNKEHVLFATSIGSKEQIFCTQFSLTKTPSITSEHSESFSLPLDEVKELPATVIEEVLPETHITTIDTIDTMDTRDSAHSFQTTQCLDNDMNISSVMNGIERKKEGTPSSVQHKATSTEEIQLDSSGSEMSSEIEILKKNLLLEIMAENQTSTEEYEKKGLVLQESFEEDLPYVPTTLPQERSVALPIIPVKERQSTGMRMYPIERPRSTTPINPSCLEEYYCDEPKTPENILGEKMKISLPKEPTEKAKNIQTRTKSPRRVSYSTSPKTWCEFAEQGLPNTVSRKSQGSIFGDSEMQPALPPRVPITPKSQWINFEEVPERRKMPKRIQTIPRQSSDERDDGPFYNYVNPEDCKCECHESTKDILEKEEDEEPLLDDAADEGLSAPVLLDALQVAGLTEKTSLISLSSLDYNGSMMSMAQTRDSAEIGHPFTMDLDVRNNRSSLASQEGAVFRGDSSSKN